MRATILTIASSLGLSLYTVMVAVSQTTPSPGPTNPNQPSQNNPLAQPGATIVINPTIDECKQGWNPSMKWTQEQFTDFCTKLGASK
jgi:hypothetical protein